MVKFVDSELEQLKREIDQMWTLVYNQMEQAKDAVLNMDKTLSQQIIVRERRVDAFELKIDSDVEDFIALFTPVAVDLRFVLAILKINGDLERIGDYADGIARFVRDADVETMDQELLKKLQLETMFSRVLTMLGELQKALRDEDAAMATMVLSQDELLDEINKASYPVRLCEKPSGCDSFLSRSWRCIPQTGADRGSSDEHSRGNSLLCRCQSAEAQ